MSRLILIGAGGHGKVVADIACSMQKWRKIEFLDDRFPELSSVASWQIIGKVEEFINLVDDRPDIGVSIGQNDMRIDLISRLKELGFNLPAIVHPTAFISESVELGGGTVVMAQAAINIDSSIGFGCIINTGSIVDHDCKLANGVHISPGGHLAGGVSIGERSWIGIGATVNPGITIENDVVVGAGAVVVNDIGQGSTVVGNPANPMD